MKQLEVESAWSIKDQVFVQVCKGLADDGQVQEVAFEVRGAFPPPNRFDSQFDPTL